MLTPPYFCVKEIFDVPDDEEFKESWWAYIGLCWKQFKTRLTNTYVFGKGDKTGETTPFHKYSSISTETWTAFVKSRLTPEFVVLFSFVTVLASKVSVVINMVMILSSM